MHDYLLRCSVNAPTMEFEVSWVAGNITRHSEGAVLPQALLVYLCVSPVARCLEDGRVLW